MSKTLLEVFKKDDVISYLEGIAYKFTLASIIKENCKVYNDKTKEEYYSKYEILNFCVPRLSEEMDTKLTTYYILN